MTEKRKYERFSLTLPTRMEIIISEKKQLFKFQTRDISSAGAFILTTEPFSDGTRFKLEFTLTSNWNKETTGALSLIKCEGNVVRSIPEGVAIQFDRDCQIVKLSDL